MINMQFTSIFFMTALFLKQMWSDSVFCQSVPSILVISLTIFVRFNQYNLTDELRLLYWHFSFT